MPDLLLALESSCDETAAAIVNRERRVLSNVVSTQHELHERFGGIVPEIASRAHVERILPVIDQAMRAAGAQASDLAGIAVATAPGLVGSLLVGLTAAKTLSLVWDVPLVAIDHIEAHIYACRMVDGPEVFPCVGFVVSGGHTNLYACDSPVDFELLGATTDDAAGEAFDKAAQVLGLGYPGGPLIEEAARMGRPDAYPFPRTFLHEDRLDFSFSGLKTAVLYAAHGAPGARVQPPPFTPDRVPDLAASFQAAVVEILVAKCAQALKKTGRRTLCVGGGVVANMAFREALTAMCKRRGYRLSLSPREYCTDNAAMGALGWEHLERARYAPLDLDVTPGLVRRRG